ncbi:MAG: hypothetical protein A3B38_00280 [Candidatus Levybacteria bacterium RIFCSPLOWO2_01_FULL_36_13]|nr:MAG: hypothetical protein A2684_01445 [Candidatus Levybacteria bacterium RIFCSPHIGHO2_01_FULL_36_15b]OGH35042.1 MAG: hypothetical protein A3B38_00280 [Candidatus Levybacteria bacterium RIFCSPLOWO2_01_FULL_36_13]
MSRTETQPITTSEHAYRRGGKLVAVYAGDKVRQYDTHDPRLVIDLGNKGDKIIVDKHSPFESGAFSDIDRVEIIRGDSKATLFFGIGRTTTENGIQKHEICSPDGTVGYAYGEKIEYLLASLLYDDPKLIELAKEGRASFDSKVQEFFEQEFQALGVFKS